MCISAHDKGMPRKNQTEFHLLQKANDAELKAEHFSAKRNI